MGMQTVAAEYGGSSTRSRSPRADAPSPVVCPGSAAANTGSGGTAATTAAASRLKNRTHTPHKHPPLFPVLLFYNNNPTSNTLPSQQQQQQYRRQRTIRFRTMMERNDSNGSGSYSFHSTRRIDWVRTVTVLGLVVATGSLFTNLSFLPRTTITTVTTTTTVAVNPTTTTTTGLLVTEQHRNALETINDQDLPVTAPDPNANGVESPPARGLLVDTPEKQQQRARDDTRIDQSVETAMEEKMKLQIQAQTSPSSSLRVRRIVADDKKSAVGVFQKNQMQRTVGDETPHVPGQSAPYAAEAAEAENLLYGYSSQQELEGRSSRFPSADERVQMYMSNWYLPPCDVADDESFVNYGIPVGVDSSMTSASAKTPSILLREVRTGKERTRGPLRTFAVEPGIGFDLLHYNKNDPQTLLECGSGYCKDMAQHLLPALTRQNLTSVPILYQFSDAEKTLAYIPAKSRVGAYPNTPHFKKFRFSLSDAERRRVTHGTCATSPRPVPYHVLQDSGADGSPQHGIIPTSQPIIYKLKVQRHYGYVQSIPTQDIAWHEKRNRAIFRGQFTGKVDASLNASALSYHEQCNLLHRCRLVYTNDQSALIDAKLALPVLEVRRDFPKVINGVELYGERVSIAEMLQYKAIIMLEG
jgi:hypothetical protein